MLDTSVQLDRFIDQVLQRLGLSRAELAQTLEISERSIARWQAGKSFPQYESRARLEELVPLLEARTAEASRLPKLHLSGNFCHAPHPELLDMIESCGVVVVDDDLYTGYRYIATDVPADGRLPDAVTSRTADEDAWQPH